LSGFLSLCAYLPIEQVAKIIIDKFEKKALKKSCKNFEKKERKKVGV